MSIAQTETTLKADPIPTDTWSINRMSIAQTEITLKADPIPTDTYRIIYADPPWRYTDKGLDEKE